MKQPNFLVIVADDLGWADVGYHGARAATPHLDQLARDGVRLEQHYVQPMCTATRVALLTGRYPSRWGDHVLGAANEQAVPFGTVTLASALREVGYDTMLSGKWHLGSKPEWGPRRYGFNRSYGCLAGGIGQYDHRYKLGPYTHTWHRDEVLLEEEGHSTDLIAREAVRWLQTPRQRPFFLYVAFTAVHIPVEAPPEWVQRYAHVADPSERLYAAYTSHMDHAVGQLIEALERTGHRRDTLVLFTSDNGAPRGGWDPANDRYPGTYPKMTKLGSNLPLRGHKSQVYEGGIRVPALAHWPGVLPAGSVLNAPLHAVDWMPTLTRLAGAHPQGDLKWDGRDVWSLLRGEETAPPRTLYWKFQRGTFALRQGEWKLVTAAGRPDELYHLAEDPNETTDLAGREPQRVAALRKVLEEQRRLDAVP
ncbi:MAG: arylsulfatase [Armatimonadota bacterium]|nr:arylsulfatase [Armatimonadota bacterium]